MATYLPGITDYIPQIQPFQPDWNFYQGALQFKQSRYDAAYEQVSNLYGSIINAPLTRDDNANTRDEFFRVINQDIKKLAGLDLSKVQNLESAKGLFNQILDDKHFKYDLMFTKNWMSEVQKGEALRECFDPEKCGGKYWDGGMEYLNFKRDEFRRAGRDESLTMDTGKYVAYQDVMGKAAKLAKEFGLEAEMDKIIGDYKFTYKNGDLIVNELNTLLHGALINDPAINDFYKVQSFNSRKNWAYSNAGNFESLEAAENAYIDNAYAQLYNQTASTKEMTNALLEDLERKGNNMSEYFKENGTYEDDPLLVYAEQLNKAYELVENSDKVYEIISNQIESVPTSQSLRAKAAAFDASMAQMLLSNDISQIASALSKKGSSLKIAEAPFAALRKQQAFAREQAKLKFERDLFRDGVKSTNEALKKLYEKGDISKAEYLEGLSDPNGVLDRVIKAEERKNNGEVIAEDPHVSSNAGDAPELAVSELVEKEKTTLKSSVTDNATKLVNNWFEQNKSNLDAHALEKLAGLLAEEGQDLIKVKTELMQANSANGKGVKHYLENYLNSSDDKLSYFISNLSNIANTDLAQLKATDPKMFEYVDANKNLIIQSGINLTNLNNYTEAVNKAELEVAKDMQTVSLTDAELIAEAVKKNPNFLNDNNDKIINLNFYDESGNPLSREESQSRLISGRYDTRPYTSYKLSEPLKEQLLASSSIDKALPFAGKNGLFFDDNNQPVSREQALESIADYYKRNTTTTSRQSLVDMGDGKYFARLDKAPEPSEKQLRAAAEKYYDKQKESFDVKVNKDFWNHMPNSDFGQNAINAEYNKVMMYPGITLNTNTKVANNVTSIFNELPYLEAEQKVMFRINSKLKEDHNEDNTKDYIKATIDFYKAYDKPIINNTFSFAKNKNFNEKGTYDYAKITFGDKDFKEALVKHLTSTMAKSGTNLSDDNDKTKNSILNFVNSIYDRTQGLNIYTRPNSTSFHKSIDVDPGRLYLERVGNITIPDNNRSNKNLKFVYDKTSEVVKLDGYILKYDNSSNSLEKVNIRDVGGFNPIPFMSFTSKDAMSNLLDILDNIETINNAAISKNNARK